MGFPETDPAVDSSSFLGFISIAMAPCCRSRETVMIGIWVLTFGAGFQVIEFHFFGVWGLGLGTGALGALGAFWGSKF